ncbi:unnamed protein product, partial [Candidula unifasciata]
SSHLATSALGFHDEADEAFTFGIDSNGSKHDLDDVCSQDSGLGGEQDRDSPSFKTPKGMPPKRSRSLTYKHYNEDTCSPLKYSPIKSSSLPRPSFSEALFISQIPESEDESIESPVLNDGFRELFKLDNWKNEAEGQVSSLIHAKLLHQPHRDKLNDPDPDDVAEISKEVTLVFSTDADTPSGCSANGRRKLQRSQSVDCRPRPSFKRCDPPSENPDPVLNKKWRGENETSTDKSDDVEDDVCDIMMPKARRLHRCHSETEAMIKCAISRMYSEPDLLGDCSKTYCLPTISGRHQDLKSISPETLSRLLADEFCEVVEEFHIIDCRYPYEFEGGHIQNAVNVYTRDGVMNKYIRSPLRVKDANKRMILVFHCEFSSERGPGLCRFLRRQDRETNKEFYPFLLYPEMYLLEGGYKHFFEHYSHLCEPRQYKTMLDKNHMEDLRKCRAKCKSWADDKISFRTGVRNLKF